MLAVLVLGPDQQLIHVLLAGDDYSKLPTEPFYLAESVLNCAGINVFTPHKKHVVVTSIDSCWQSRISSTAGAWAIDPATLVVRSQPYHGLRSAFEVRVHRRPL